MRRRIEILAAALSVFCLIIGSFELNAYASNEVPRIAGINRYLTAVEVSKAGWANSSNIILATGADFPDALCAVPLAKQLNAPILLTERNSIRTEVLNEIKRLKPANAYIIGGTGVISSAIVSKLGSMGIKCTRLYDSDRYGTAIKVAQYMASHFSMSSEVALATGGDFPDALSVASAAAIKNMPVLLLPPSGIPDSVKSYIKNQKITRAYVIGGVGVITPGSASAIPCANERVAGSDRYGTNSAVISKFSGIYNFSQSYLATGQDFPDALAGSALAAKTKSPVILTSPVPVKTTVDLVNSVVNSISNLKALGGDGVVPYSTYNTLYPWVASIGDMSGEVYQDQIFTLPQNVTASMTNGTTRQVAISWNPSVVDTSSTGDHIFQGTVSRYGKSVLYTLTVAAGHPIMGDQDPDITAAKMASFLRHYNPNILITINPDPAKPQVTVENFCQMYLDEGAAEGVRGDIAFAQSVKETGYFKFGGQVLPQQYNYAGIGATNGSPSGAGAWFADQRQGIRAQIQHLKGYASTQPPVNPIVDTRYSLITHGIAPNWEDLDGRWAVPGDGYGEDIITLYHTIKSSSY